MTPAQNPAAAAVTREPLLARGAPKRRALRVIATLEAIKGLVALAATLGLLSLLQHDLHHLAATLIGHVGLDPGGRYPTLLMHYVDLLYDANLRTLLLAAGAYVVVRLTEAWGLWFGHSWGEWLGAFSGALYLPFELRHLLHAPGLFGALVLAINLGLVVFLGWELWRERHPIDPAGGR